MQYSFKILKMLLLQISDLETNLQHEIINASDIYGDTPLHILCRDMVKYKVNNFTIFDYMIKLGADPNLLNNEKIRPIDILNEFPIGEIKDYKYDNYI